MRLRLLTFNIAHARGLMPHQGLTPLSRIRRNLDRIAELLLRLDPDIAGFQEIDQDSDWNGRFDHLEYLRERCHYRFSAFGANASLSAGLRLHYGNAILSRYPIVRSEAVRFDWRPVGGKGFLYCEIDIGHRCVLPVVNLHLHHRSRTRRRRQAEDITGFVARLSGTAAGAGFQRLPPVFLGDFNAPSRARLDAGQYLLREALPLEGYTLHPGDDRTYPSIRPLRNLDFVLVPAALQVLRGEAVRTRLSDHLPVVVDLQLRTRPAGGP